MESASVRHNRWPQYLAAFSIFLMALVNESETGWTTPFVGNQLHKKPSPISLTETDVMWVASIINIGGAVGSIAGTIDIILSGSKKAVFHTGLLKMVSLVWLAIADSGRLLLISRFIAGTATGMFYVSYPLYIIEISKKEIRGNLISAIANGMAVGYVLGNGMGAYLPTKTFAVSMLSITIWFLLLFSCLPDSPYHLMMQARTEEAVAAVMCYENGLDIRNRLVSLQSYVKGRQSITYKNVLKEFKMPHNKIVLFKVIIMYILMQLSGLYVVGFYMEIILREGQLMAIDPPAAVIIISSLGIIGGWFAILAIRRFGRKAVLVTADIGIALSLIGLALHYQFLEMGYDPLILQWCLIASTIALEFFINFGITSIPGTYISEIFPPNINIYGCCLVNATCGLVSFLSIQTYPMLVDSLGYYVYYVYALMMILSAIFTVTQLPETKDKSEEEIRNMLMKMP